MKTNRFFGNRGRKTKLFKTVSTQLKKKSVKKLGIISKEKKKSKTFIYTITN